MGVDYFPCSCCSASICDAGDYETCDGCGASFCVDCSSEKDNTLLYDVEYVQVECINCTQDYNKRNIQNDELLGYLMKKHGYKSEDQIIEELKKSKK